MGLDVGGTQITQASSVLTINTGASMTMRSTGPVLRPQQTQFIAIGTGEWVYIEGWYKMPFQTAPVNVNSCYSTANARFTAPVNGWYFFEAHSYLLKDNANNGYYFHPVFAVNGGISTATVSGSPNYRLRGYGEPIATYCSGGIYQTYALVAGDYVEHHIYASGGWNGSTGNRYYGSHNRFTGFLLG